MKTLIIIPSRLSATRLPGKPLLQINGLSIISHVFKKAVDTNIGEVYVAAQDQEIIDDVQQNGGQAILTSVNHKTGTDRTNEALDKIGISDIDLVMNLQGDEPFVKPEYIKQVASFLADTSYECVIPHQNIDDYNNVNRVKLVAHGDRVIYLSRSDVPYHFLQYMICKDLSLF